MDRLVVLDSYSLAYRAYYAISHLNDSTGRPTNALFGFISMLTKAIEDLKPTHLVAAFDVHGPTFRHKMYAPYKGTRKPMPEDLIPQIDMIKDVLGRMGIAIVELIGYEADDVLGTLAKHSDFDTILLSGDKDNLQLVSETTTVWLNRRGLSDVTKYDLAKLKEEGLTPELVIEMKSLMGDSSDNIPGVAGVGAKTAQKLLEEYKTLDGVYENIDNIKGTLQTKLIENKELAYLSRELATIDVNVPFTYRLEEYKFNYPLNNNARVALQDYELFSLIKRLKFDDNVDDEQVFSDLEQVKIIQHIIDTVADFDKLLATCLQAQKVSINVRNLNKISIAFDKENEYEVEYANDLFGELSYDYVMSGIRKLLENEKIAKILYDAKTLMHNFGCKIVGAYDDLMVATYLVNGGNGYKTETSMLERYKLNVETPASSMFSLIDEIIKSLEKCELTDLYRSIELPLIEVLYEMEKVGIEVDNKVLQELTEEYSTRIENVKKLIFSYVDVPFNINSPIQLKEVLFEKLNLPELKFKKNKTGFSLNVDVLTKMKNMHPIIELILEYRQLAKIFSTYIEGIKTHIDSKGRVHTEYKQTITATGRLSSIKPNLQNIPIRNASTRVVRKMFTASRGNTLVTADYSQIELRLLAHFSGDEKLITSYNNGLDIHSKTAAEIFGVKLDNVTSKMRREAKAVNFGIIYGISSYGLSENTNITRKQADMYITKYFETYPSVKLYMENNVSIAKADNQIRTITKRIRQIPEIKSANHNVRKFGERIAMNMPLQGSSADIIKIAMLNIWQELNKRNLKSKLILQIHDELVIDTCPCEIEEVKNILVDKMENAVHLKVPLIADVGIGDNLYETK